jgi:alpha-tubulin suppressor-like RCC1 family protein/phosphatidylethanolamine-binding protein (PEBP) family uncharacterized protein
MKSKSTTRDVLILMVALVVAGTFALLGAFAEDNRGISTSKKTTTPPNSKSEGIFAGEGILCGKVSSGWASGDILEGRFVSLSQQVLSLRGQLLSLKSITDKRRTAELKNEIRVLKHRIVVEAPACQRGPTFVALATKPKFSIVSSAFKSGRFIPSEHTCWLSGEQDEGEGISPPISWKNAPKQTTHFALLAQDPDIDFIHWFIVFGKKSVYFKTGLPLGVPVGNSPTAASYQVLNDYEIFGYSGLCPEPLEKRRLTFELFALRGAKLKSYGDSPDQIRKNLKKLTLAKASYVGSFTAPNEPESPAPTNTPTITPTATITPTNTPTPTPTPTNTPVNLYDVAQVAAGNAYHTCAISSTAGVRCWGHNRWGQIGDGTKIDRLKPRPVSGLTSTVTKIATGYGHTCAISVDGGAKCWGRNTTGSLGNNTFADSDTPVNVTGLDSGVSELTAGETHTCAIVGDAIKCWGGNGTGQVGDGSNSDRKTPVSIISSGMSQVSAGLSHTCAVSTSGGVQCWGNNNNGRLGDGTITNRWNPVGVSGLSSNVTQVAAGFHHSCALLDSGAVKCWGRNSDGALGDGTTTDRWTPVDVSGLSSGVSQIATGGGFSCALLSTGGVKCWGDLFTSTPSDISGLSSGVTQITAGARHVCALLTGGGLKCWLNSTYGAIGDGTQNYASNPVDVLSGP